MPAAAADRWTRRFHPRPGAEFRLACLPHAGGSASYYHPVSAALPERIEALAVQYPGRQDRRAEPLVPDLAELADGLHAVLLAWTDRPLALFGHSMGALLAFEVADRLRRSGAPPAALFVSGRRAPSRWREDEAVRELDDDGLVAELGRLGGVEPELLADPALRRLVLPVVRADYTAVETHVYRPAEPLDCPVVALTGDRDPRVEPEEAAAWAAHTTGPFELHTFAGGHFFLNEHRERVVELVAERLLAVGDGRLGG
ncbi:thioesterase II family protein [Allonocardiopsis opalescens]|uniref:Surfactin synthase thioesterase subunit n=1 Tax=Allonocardiopsis opalescens TaxID=1144618 RepID=A0A2T0QAL9_9ACTN|nr:alpha/beta fold hydrolase [Allonocardiopsis opalescens]PRY00904.1 surfactin synthase thioesterase subunit [Allonocardiopsis opalescens]